MSGDSAADGTISNKLRSVTINVVNESGKPTDELNGTNDANTPVVGGTLEVVLNVPPQRRLSVRSVIITLRQMADAGTPDRFTDLNNTNAEKHKYIIKELSRINCSVSTLRLKRRKPRRRINALSVADGYRQINILFKYSSAVQGI